MASEMEVEEEDVPADAEASSDTAMLIGEEELERLWREIPLHAYLGGG